jgi:hypothetical protein
MNTVGGIEKNSEGSGAADWELARKQTASPAEKRRSDVFQAPRAHVLPALFRFERPDYRAAATIWRGSTVK